MSKTVNLPENQNIEIKKQKQPWWRWVITFLAVGFFVYLIFSQRKEFLNTIRTISLGYAISGLAILFLSRQVVAARWHALLQVSQKPISYWETLKLTYTGLFASNFLPTSIGGDLVRFIGMVQNGIDSALVLASLIMDRIVGAAGMSFFVPGGAYFLAHPIQTALISTPSNIVLSNVSVEPFLRKIWQKSIDFMKKLIQDLLFWLQHPLNLAKSLGFTILHELLLFTMFWLFLKSLGQNVSYWTIASLYSLSYLITLIPLSIGGLGIQEGSITYLFSTFGGVTMQAALALAILNRLAFLINSLPGAFFLPAILRKKDEEDKKLTI